MDPLNPQCQLGQKVSKYTLNSILGEGSFAVVFLGVYNTEQVAIKCLYKQGLSPSQLSLQREEVFILQQLQQNQNIIQLIDTVETQDYFYMILEYCEIDLFDFILKTKPTQSHALDLFEQLCKGVQYCHDKGIYHRDIKPENILLTSRRGRRIVKITDFGLSTRDQLSTEYGCGSIRYMSPECMKKHSQTPYLSSANDVWSLGVILINLLTCKNPWVEPSPKDKHFKTHLLSKSPDSFKKQFGFSDGLVAVLKQCFDLQPLNRPSPIQLFLMVKEVMEGKTLQVPVKSIVKHGMLTPTSIGEPFGMKTPKNSTSKILVTPSSLQTPIGMKNDKDIAIAVKNEKWYGEMDVDDPRTEECPGTLDWFLL